MNLIKIALVTAIAAVPAVAHADHLNIDVEGATIEGNSVVFPSVKIDKDGYVVIHAVENGEPVIPASIGHTAVSAGDSENVSVEIEGGAMEGTDYVAMIHYETNDNGTYDFAEGMTDVDTPGMRPDNTPYALPFKVGGM
ncbi:hypothetical protein [Aliihoeflea sp. 2WW]|jgi:hypothetical protein|uniref:DUF7282 domain-containing protein n=1 Tax=Aliihoeflea sp. 2WW TaxID=1381123 RepID=UPI000466DDFF|nr:hypothetical protein [Aliihoeflea sp. 2WW]MBL0933223.1 hypothetical protein [Rhizobiaceae bacterium]